jgi:retron-type reverse transcriptase
VFGFIRRLFQGPAATPARVARPARFSLNELSRRLGLPESQLRTLPVSYSAFQMAKRTGGTRTILAPAPVLKDAQRRILHRLLRGLRSHPCATGFERGHSIVTNARPHIGREVVVKLDLRDFFGTTSAARVRDYFRWIGWDDEACDVLVRLCTHEGSLPQGAPTSPRLSNLVNYRLDARLEALAQHFEMSYSRYADDLTFSGAACPPLGHRNPKTLEPGAPKAARMNSLILRVKEIVADAGYALHTKKKLRIARRHDRQVVTGLVVNEKVHLPRATRRRLRAIEHRLKAQGKATLTPQQLAGWRALQNMIANAE